MWKCKRPEQAFAIDGVKAATAQAAFEMLFELRLFESLLLLILPNQECATKIRSKSEVTKKPGHEVDNASAQGRDAGGVPSRLGRRNEG